MATSLDTAIIFTTQMEELAAFYAEALEIGPYESSPGHLGCKVGAIYFGFDQVEEPQSGSAVTLWFAVDDLEATFERLVSMGAEVRYPPTRKPWGAFLAALSDPDGNMIGLSQQEPQS